MQVHSENLLSWVYLAFAIVFEVAGTTAMKLSVGFTRLVPSIFLFVFYVIAFVLLTLSLKKIDVSIAYAIWAGLGTLLIVILSAIIFHEPLTLLKIISILLIVLGVLGLELYG